MKKIIIDIKDAESKNAGSKARNDLNNILNKNHFEVCYISNSSSLEKSNFGRLVKYVQNILKIRNSAEEIILQYPTLKILGRNQVNYFFSKKRILVIHDINSLRSRESSDSVKKEISFFNSFPLLVSHNSHMTKWLKDNGCTSKIINLDIFDYLTDELPRSGSIDNSIVVAGNLDPKKSEFIYKIKYPLSLYGPNFDESQKNEFINYKGSFNPNELPGVLSGKWGLIWDGSFVDKCDPYLMYNNPHKLSLYIVSELPVIVWSKAAVADFVKENNIGVTIDNLNDLPYILNNVKECEYNQMKENTKTISLRLRNGYYTLKAIREAENAL